MISLILFSLPLTLFGQADEAATSIKELRKGTLILRIPTDKAKIDTLSAMANRSNDPAKKEKLEKQLNRAIEERDTLFSDYVYAFKNNFDYCAVGYFFDYEGRDLNTASYYNLEGERISVADLSEKPLFYLYFERTSGSKIDGLVIYDRNLRKVDPPFPNDFATTGINTIFLSISGKNFPFWRVGKINKQLYKYLDRVLSYEKYADEPSKNDKS